jgi:hypothetical protein
MVWFSQPGDEVTHPVAVGPHNGVIGGELDNAVEVVLRTLRGSKERPGVSFPCLADGPGQGRIQGWIPVKLDILWEIPVMGKLARGVEPFGAGVLKVAGKPIQLMETRATGDGEPPDQWIDGNARRGHEPVLTPGSEASRALDE